MTFEVGDRVEYYPRVRHSHQPVSGRIEHVGIRIAMVRSDDDGELYSVGLPQLRLIRHGIKPSPICPR